MINFFFLVMLQLLINFKTRVFYRLKKMSIGLCPLSDKLTDTCNGHSLRDFQTWLHELYYGHQTYLGRKRVIDVGVRIMVFNATFNNTSVLSWRSVLLVATTGLPGENHRHVVCHWQTLSHNVVLSGFRTNNVSVKYKDLYSEFPGPPKVSRKLITWGYNRRTNPRQWCHACRQMSTALTALSPISHVV